MRAFLFLLPGLALMCLALLGDHLSPGPSNGFGPKQQFVFVMGIVVAAIGLCRLKPQRRIVAKWALAIGTLIFVSCALEFAATLMLLATGDERRPFLVNLSKQQMMPMISGRTESDKRSPQLVQMSFLDPHCGYAHNPSVLPEFGPQVGFGSYGNLHAPQAQRIVTLGGSTTDSYSLPENWPKLLADLLAAKDLDYLIQNGGVGGFSSNQELLKLIRDVLPLKPSIVISLSGINDVGFIHCVPDHPMVHPHQKQIMEHLFDSSNNSSVVFSNLLGFVRRHMRLRSKVEGGHLGTQTHVSPAEQWQRNVRLMHAVAEEVDIHYLCFLQPTMGVGDYLPTPEEKEMFAAKKSKKNYQQMLERFYERARVFARKSPYVVDLTDVFSGETGLYADPRHPNARGNEILSRRILNELESLNLLGSSEVIVDENP